MYRTNVWKRMCIPRVEMWIQLIVRTTPDCRGSSYRAISLELIQVSCSTVASRIYSLEGFLSFLGLPAFTIAVVVTLDVSGRLCCTHRNKFQSGWKWIRLYSAKCCVAVPLPLLHTLKDNTLLQYPVGSSVESPAVLFTGFRANLFFTVCVWPTYFWLLPCENVRLDTHFL
jgi:hypothetical protein